MPVPKKTTEEKFVLSEAPVGDTNTLDPAVEGETPAPWSLTEQQTQASRTSSSVASIVPEEAPTTQLLLDANPGPLPEEPSVSAVTVTARIPEASPETSIGPQESPVTLPVKIDAPDNSTLVEPPPEVTKVDGKIAYQELALDPSSTDDEAVPLHIAAQEKSPEFRDEIHARTPILPTEVNQPLAPVPSVDPSSETCLASSGVGDGDGDAAEPPAVSDISAGAPLTEAQGENPDAAAEPTLENVPTAVGEPVPEQYATPVVAIDLPLEATDRLAAGARDEAENAGIVPVPPEPAFESPPVMVTAHGSPIAAHAVLEGPAMSAVCPPVAIDAAPSVAVSVDETDRVLSAESQAAAGFALLAEPPLPRAAEPVAAEEGFALVGPPIADVGEPVTVTSTLCAEVDPTPTPTDLGVTAKDETHSPPAEAAEPAIALNAAGTPLLTESVAMTPLQSDETVLSREASIEGVVTRPHGYVLVENEKPMAKDALSSESVSAFQVGGQGNGLVEDDGLGAVTAGTPP